MIIEKNLNFDESSVIYFIHIPKSGGYTVREGILKYFNRNECLRINEPESTHYQNINISNNLQSPKKKEIVKNFIKKIPLLTYIYNKFNIFKKLLNNKEIDPLYRNFNSLSKGDLNKIRFISSSKDICKFEKINEKQNFYLMIIRDPLSRIQSSYYYARTKEFGRKPYIQAAKKYNIDDYVKFLLDNRPQWICNTYSLCISGTNNFKKSCKIIDDVFYLAAPLEKMDEFAMLLTYKFFGKSKLFDIKNINKNNPKKIMFSDKTKEIIITNNSVDIKLKSYIETEFERIYKIFY